MPDPAGRYHRQMLLPGWGEPAQARLGACTVAVVGVGALGSTAADLLARAGVGRLLLIDRDVVEPTNLQRQTLYAEADVGRPKALAAADRLRAVNSTIALEPMPMDLGPEDALGLARRADLLLDGTDNFATRYLLNDAALATGTAMVYAGAVRTRGTVMPVLPGLGPCLRCLAEQMPIDGETCETAGVLGPAVVMTAARQAALALRLLTHQQPPPLRLESLDAMEGRWRSVDVTAARDPHCLCCGRRRFEFLDGSGTGRAVPLCGRHSVQIAPATRRGIDATATLQRLHHHGRFEARDGLLTGTFAAESGETGRPIGLLVFADGRAIISGTTEPARARSIYDRYLGG